MGEEFRYAGYPAYLDEAAKSLGASPEVVAQARNQPALTALNTLVVQACDAPPAARAEILGYAEKFRDGLKVAAEAAASILQVVKRELDVKPPEPTQIPAPEPEPVPLPGTVPIPEAELPPEPVPIPEAEMLPEPPPEAEPRLGRHGRRH